jgi:hemolysin activation/secretion protein
LKAGNFAGSSQTYGIDLSYPLIRTRSFNISMTANYDGREFSNTANRVISSRYRSDAVSTGFNGNVYDDLFEGGTNSFSLTAVAGILDLDGSPNKAGDAATTQAQNQFVKLKGNASRTQTLTDVLSAYVSISGQYAFKNLDSSEKFFLGGASGVRAYPSSEGGGS